MSLFSKSRGNSVLRLFIEGGSSRLRSGVAHAFTLLLFTKSDIKTVLIPISIFGMVAAPVHSISHGVSEFLWVWLHLLLFTTSNQSCSLQAVAEDAENKPFRPIPAGRISFQATRILHWTVVVACLAISSCISSAVLISSMLVIAITLWYNELDGKGRHWLIRNWLNGIGFGAFQCGATLIAGVQHSEMDKTAIRAILVSIYLYATTNHAQDFEDAPGDVKVGRSTLALAFPRLSRMSILLNLTAWSLLLAHIWNLPMEVAAIFLVLALFVGFRFCFKYGRDNDKVSFFWYNLWLSCAYALPGIYRARLRV